jgi:hypothetical protein
MPQLTALIYNYTDGTKNYHRIKAKAYHHGPVHWSARTPSTVKVRLSQPIVRPSIPESQDEYTYIGTFRCQFSGQQQPEPPMHYVSSGIPAGWLWWNDSYYSWQQMPEINIEPKQAIANSANYYAHKNRTTKRAHDMWESMEEEAERSAAMRMRYGGA